MSKKYPEVYSEIGSYLPTLLFEQDDDYIKQILKEQIENIIENYEPRVQLNSVEIYTDSIEDEFHGRVTIKITYSVINLNITDTYIYTINRLR